MGFCVLVIPHITIIIIFHKTGIRRGLEERPGTGALDARGHTHTAPAADAESTWRQVEYHIEQIHGKLNTRSIKQHHSTYCSNHVCYSFSIPCMHVSTAVIAVLHVAGECRACRIRIRMATSLISPTFQSSSARDSRHTKAFRL